jgi:predicted CoA-binding protein
MDTIHLKVTACALMTALPDFVIDDITGLRRILSSYKRVAVVGLSENWYRPSYFAAKYLQDHGYRIIPVNPRYQQVLGEPCYPSLHDAAQSMQEPALADPIQVVDCFRRAPEIPALVDEAISIGAKVIWMQLGVINIDAAHQAHEAGLQVVMDRCMKIEYARFFGGLNFIGVNTGIISAKRPTTFPH